MNFIRVVEEVQLKMEYKKMIKDIGFDESCMVLYELIKGAEILAETLSEYKRQQS